MAVNLLNACKVGLRACNNLPQPNPYILFVVELCNTLVLFSPTPENKDTCFWPIDVQI